MRDASRDSVTPGASPAPLGARGAVAGEPRTSPGPAVPPSSFSGPRRELSFASSPWIVAAVLVGSLAAYAAIAVDVVEGGWLSAVDDDLSEWVARSMPSVAEWIARVLSWIGGWLGVTIVVVVVLVLLLRRGESALGVLLVAVAFGVQLVNWMAKEGYDRPRPTAGSPIDLPSSSSFPSGHAMTGVALFGLLGLILARELASTRARTAAMVAGFALGALIGASRVVLNVHFLTDVLGGAALGLAWLAVCLLVYILVGARRRYADRS
jgi:membrane-associated phospholipid phosphatase